MPQLHPDPWFTILTLSWLVLLAIVVPKVMAHTFINDPATQKTQASKMNSWSWSWP